MLDVKLTHVSITSPYDHNTQWQFMSTLRATGGISVNYIYSCHPLLRFRYSNLNELLEIQHSDLQHETCELNIPGIHDWRVTGNPCADPVQVNFAYVHHRIIVFSLRSWCVLLGRREALKKYFRNIPHLNVTILCSASCHKTSAYSNFIF